MGSLWDLGPDRVGLRVLHYNRSLNLYMIGDTNTYLRMDDFEGNRALAIKCKRLEKWCLDNWCHGLMTKSSPFGDKVDCLRAYAEYAIGEVGVNPYFEMWEALLPFLCPGAGNAFLACCQNTYDELVHARAVLADIRKYLSERLDGVQSQLGACLSYAQGKKRETAWKKYRADLARYNAEMLTLTRKEAVSAITTEMMDNSPSSYIPTDGYSFENLRERVNYWRAVRRERTAVRIAAEEAYLATLWQQGSEPGPTPLAKVVPEEVTTFSWPGGAILFAQACAVKRTELKPSAVAPQFTPLLKTVKLIKSKNVTCGRYFDYLFSSTRYRALAYTTMRILTENFNFLLDYYPHEQMFTQLCQLREEEEFQAAGECLKGEAEVIQFHSASTARGLFGNLSSYACSLAKRTHNIVADSAMYSAAYGKLAIVKTCKFLFADVAKEMFNYAKDQFMHMFGGYFREAVAVREFVLQMWAKCSTWCEKVSEKFSTSLQYLREFSALALMMILVGGIIMFAEKALVHLGLMSTVGFCINLFLTGVTSYYLGKMAFMHGDSLKSLIGAVHGFIIGLFSTDGEENAKASVLDSIITGMTTIGASLVSFQCDTIIQAGRIANAFDQLRRGKDALLTFAAWVTEGLGKIADKITGRDTRFFNDLAATVKVDVRSWIKNSRRLLIEAQTLSLGDKFLHDQVERLYVDGEKIQTTTSGLPTRLSTSFQLIVRDIMKDLQGLLERCARAGKCEGRREEPIWVYIYGDPQCGKTNFMNMVSHDLCDYLGLPCTEYTRTPTDPFWSQYARQNVVRIDDLSAVESTMEGEMINIVSSNPYRLNMASLEEKGMNFYSRIIVTSSNRWRAPLNAGLNTPDAYQERITVMVRVRRKEGSSFDANDMLKASEFQVVNPKNLEPLFPDVGANGWTTAAEAMVSVKNIAGAKYEDQKKAMEWFRRKCKPVNQYMETTARFVSKMSLGSVIFLSPQQLLKYGVNAAENTLCVCCDRKLYIFDTEYQLVNTVAVPDTDAGPLEMASMKSFFTKTQIDLALTCQSDLVESFLKSIIYGELIITEDLKLPVEASPCQREFFYENVGPLERIYMRLMQKRVAQIKNAPYLSVESGSWWESIFAMASDTIAYLKDNGCSILLLVASLAISGALLYGFIKAFSLLICGKEGLAGAAAAMTAVEAKAVISSGGMDRAYRARNMPKLYRYTYAKGVAEHPTAVDCCAMIIAPRGMNIKAVQFKSNFFLMTRHQMMSLWDGDEIVVYQAWLDRCTVAIFNKEDCITHANSELVHWHCKFVPALPKHLSELFHIDLEKDVPSYFKTRGYGLEVKEGQFEFKYVDTQAWLNKKSFLVTANMADGPYRREIPTSVVVEYDAVNFDCGMFFTCQIEGKEKIVGLLVAGVKNQAYVNFVPALDIAEAKGVPNYIPEPQEKFDGYQKQGFLLPADTPRIPKKNNFVQVPEYLAKPVAVMAPCALKEPSVLSLEDKRCPPNVDPIAKAVSKKFTKPMDMLDAKLLEEVACDIVESWKDVQHIPLKDVPLSEAINGQNPEEGDLESFVLSTSPGYPYVLTRKGKGKHEYFQETNEGAKELKPGTLAEELYNNLVEVSSTTVPTLVCVECPKDELLKKEKIETGTCRLFSILPLHFNLYWRVKTLEFTKFIQNSRAKLPCQVGINVNSHEWKRLFDGLEAKGNGKAINCDYSCFDGLLNQQLLKCIARMMNALYWEDSKLELEQRENMLLSLWGRYSLVDNQVLQVFAGLPSGCSLTVVLNSIFNEILIRYVYRKRVPHPQRVSFSQYVQLYVYGDDNLIAIRPECTAFFDGNIIKAELAKYSITITDGSDKSSPTIDFKSLWELDFLKRKFMRNRKGQLVAPLDFSSIFSCLIWVRPTKSKLSPHVQLADMPWVDTTEELLDNVNTALFELYIWDDRNVFDVLRRFYLSKFDGWFTQLRIWEECEALHSAMYTQMGRFRPQIVMDHLITVDDVRIMRNAGPSNFCTPVTKELAYAGIAYNPEDSTQVLVAFNGLRASEKGFEVEVEWGMGTGREPTRAWFLKWKKKVVEKGTKRDILPFLKQAIDAGKTIVFRDHAPYTSCWLAICGLADKFKLADVEELVLLHSNLTGCKGILSSYVNSPWPVLDSSFRWHVNPEAKQLLGKGDKTKFVTHSFIASDTFGDMSLPEQLQVATKHEIFPFVLLGKEKMKPCCYIRCDKICPIHKVVSSKNCALDAFEICYRSRCKSLKAVKFMPEWIRDKKEHNEDAGKYTLSKLCKTMPLQTHSG